MRKTIIVLFLFPLISQAQEMHYKEGQGGTFSLGLRSTVSTFNGHHGESTGLGLGGQFRLQLSDQVNTDWFFDYLQSDVGDFAQRTDYHIGWSVLFYPLRNTTPVIRPYFLAGHCFDYTHLVENGNRDNYTERWSSAVQGGVGTHINLSPRLDVSLVAQYMMHLGNEVGAHQHGNEVHFHEESGSSIEGHLLLSIGINYKIVDLW